jgi:hypothetical protein
MDTPLHRERDLPMVEIVGAVQPSGNARSGVFLDVG